MLDKFRQNFPTHSLMSELLRIYDGRYFVQYRIADEACDLFLHAIASGSTVEDAEDKARDRVLKLFFAGEKTDTPVGYGSPEEKASFSINEEIKKGAFVCLKDDGTCGTFKTPLSDEAPHVIGVATEPIKGGDVVEISFGMNSEVGKAEVAKKRSPKKKEPEPVEVVTETAITEPEIVKPVLPENEEISNAITAEQSLNQSMIESGINPAITTPESDAQLIKEGLLIEDPQLELAIPQANYEPLDFEAVMSRTTNQLKRLGWTTEDGKKHLTETYGKKSRQLLTDEELIEFLNYLESQPDPS